MTSDLEFVWENALSFSDKTRPSGMKYIGTVTKEFTKGVREFLFYKDEKNHYWYESRWKIIKN